MLQKCVPTRTQLVNYKQHILWKKTEEMFLFNTFNTCMKIAANIALIKLQTILYYWVVCVVLTVGGGGYWFRYIFVFVWRSGHETLVDKKNCSKVQITLEILLGSANDIGTGILIALTKFVWNYLEVYIDTRQNGDPLSAVSIKCKKQFYWGKMLST